ncbi:MAG: 6,7-dimethyl-8-ribityllumazine synthase [Flavobacteriales bacterium]
MSSKRKNLSSYKPFESSFAPVMRMGIVVSEWNKEITSALYEGALDTLFSFLIKKENILTVHVPGSFELPIGAQMLIENDKPDAVICLGSIIQGETRHFEFLCQAVAKGIQDVALKYNTPLSFGVLTDNDIQQARDRSGGKHGNKGVEAAVSAIRMADFKLRNS